MTGPQGRGKPRGRPGACGLPRCSRCGAGRGGRGCVSVNPPARQHLFPALPPVPGPGAGFSVVRGEAACQRCGAGAGPVPVVCVPGPLLLGVPQRRGISLWALTQVHFHMLNSSFPYGLFVGGYASNPRRLYRRPGGVFVHPQRPGQPGGGQQSPAPDVRRAQGGRGRTLCHWAEWGLRGHASPWSPAE